MLTLQETLEYAAASPPMGVLVIGRHLQRLRPALRPLVGPLFHRFFNTPADP